MNKRVFPGQAPAPRMVDLAEADGTTLRATYFARTSLVRECSASPVRPVTARSGRKSRRGTVCFDARLSRLWGPWRNGKLQGPARGGPAAGHRGRPRPRDSLRQPGTTSGAGVLQLLWPRTKARARLCSGRQLCGLCPSRFHTRVTSIPGTFQHAPIGLGGAAVGDHCLQG